MNYCFTHIGCNGKNISIYTKDENLIFEKCNDCGIIWRSAISINITKPYEQKYFDSKSYDKRRGHKVKKSGWMIDLATLHHSKINSILEVGCSIGCTLEAAKNRKIEHLGIDISEFAVDFCTKKGLHASRADFDDLKKSGEKFDLIYMQHVLEHFQNPFEVLNNCNQLLNENGLVLIMVPNSKYGRAEKQLEKHRFYSLKGVGSEHFVYFNYDNLARVLKATGFYVVQQNYPIFTGKYINLTFFVNRLLRRSLSLFKSDQELLVIAKKAPLLFE